MTQLTLADLAVRLEADAGGLSAGLRKAMGELANFSKEVSGRIEFSRSLNQNINALKRQEGTLKTQQTIFRELAAGTEKGTAHMASLQAKIKQVSQRLAELGERRRVLSAWKAETDKTVSAMVRQESALARNAIAVQQLNRVGKDLGMPAVFMARNVLAFKEYSAAVMKAGTDTRTLARAQELFKIRMDAANKAIIAHKESLRNQVEQGRFNTLLDNMGSAAVLAAGPLSGIGARLIALNAIFQRTNNIMQVFTFATVAAFTAALFSLGAMLVRHEREFDRYNKALKFMTGSQAGANQVIDALGSVAERTGQSLSQLIQSYTDVAGAARGTVVQGKAMLDLFEQVTLAGAVLGISQERMGRAFLAIQQIVSKGVVQQEELRQQLSEAIPGATQIAARAFGVSTATLNDMVRKGLIPASEFVTKFTAQLKKELAPAADEANKGVNAAINQSKTALTNLNRALSAILKIGPTLTGIFQTIRNVLDSIRVALPYIAGAVVGLASAFIGLGVALAGIKLVSFIAGIKAVGVSFWAAYTGAMAFNGALTLLAKHPVMVIVGLIAAIVGMVTGFNLAKKAMQELQSEIDKANKLTGEFTSTMGRISPEKVEAVRDAVFDLSSKIEELKGKPLFSKEGLKLFNEAGIQAELSQLFREDGGFVQYAKKFRTAIGRALNIQDLIRVTRQKLWALEEEVLGSDPAARKKLIEDTLTLKELLRVLNELQNYEKLEIEFKDMEALQELVKATATDAEKAFAEINRLKDLSIKLPSLQLSPEQENIFREAIRRGTEEAWKGLEIVPPKHELIDPLAAFDDVIAQSRTSIEKYNNALSELSLLQHRLDLAKISGDATAEEFDLISEAILRMKESALRGTTEFGELQRIMDSTRTESEKVREELQRLAELRLFANQNLSGTQLVQALEALERMEKQIKQNSKMVVELGDIFENSFADALLAAESLRDVLQGLLQDLLSVLTRALIVAPLVRLILGAVGDMAGGNSGSFIGNGGNAFAGIDVAAKGLAFGKSRVIPMDKGGILGMPTIFPMRGNKIAVGGERKDEAILPLTRGTDGRLGVQASDSGSSMVVQIIDQRGAGAPPIEREETTGADGIRMLRLTIKKEIRSMIAGGELDSSMSSSYGIKRRGT